MAKRATAEAIAEWADKQTAKSNKPKQHRLTDADKALALRYHAEGLPQVEIAKRLGVTQPAISQWLAKCQDTTKEAGLYLRGQALHMAEKIVKKGRASDWVAVQKGINVLEEQRVSSISVTINGVMLGGMGHLSQSETELPIVDVHALSPPVSQPLHSLSAEQDPAKVNINALISPAVNEIHEQD